VHVTIWGCRGSLATTRPETVRYGGTTACIEVALDDGSLVILHAGSGIRRLGLTLEAGVPRRIDLLLTHLHLDHVTGLGFFMPLWDPATELHIWGPSSAVASLEEQIAAYLAPPLFPVPFSEIPSRLVFHDAPEGEWRIGSAAIRSEPVQHPGPTVGYRIEDGGWTLAYLTDHEPALGVDLGTLSPEWISGYRLAHRADVLLHDCQYSEQEYPQRVGWGHSSVLDAVTFARRAEVGRLVTFHHDPLHSDASLEAMLARAKELWADTDSACVIGQEGATLTPR